MAVVLALVQVGVAEKGEGRGLTAISWAASKESCVQQVSKGASTNFVTLYCCVSNVKGMKRKNLSLCTIDRRCRFKIIGVDERFKFYYPYCYRSL